MMPICNWLSNPFGCMLSAIVAFKVEAITSAESCKIELLAASSVTEDWRADVLIDGENSEVTGRDSPNPRGSDFVG